MMSHPRSCIPSGAIVLAVVFGLPAILAGTLQAAPGDLDPAFGGFGSDGIASVGAFLPAMAVDQDGRIVLAGPSGLSVMVKRFLSNGAIDDSFGSHGTALFTHPSYPATPTSVAIQPDGKIVVAGWFDTGPSNYMIVRLTTSGNLDLVFGSGGWVNYDLGGDSDVIEAVVIQPDGRIVVAGRSFVGGDWDFSCARYSAFGTPDSSFAGDGKITIGFGGDDKCEDAALQDDGKLVMVGHSVAFDRDFAVGRLNANGTLDTSFDFDGKTTFGFGDAEAAKAVAIEPDGRIIVVGSNYCEVCPPIEAGKLALLRPDGSLDDGFDGDGKLSYDQSSCEEVVIQPDGRLVTVGIHGPPSGSWNVAFNRFNLNGTLDASFDGGELFIDLGSSSDGGYAVALRPDGRILADCQCGGSGRLVQLWPDATFDGGGRQAAAFDDITFSPGSDERARGMAIQTDGKIVAAGEVALAGGTETDFALMRFLSDGRPDTAFGVHGRTALSFQNADIAKAVAIQTDGKIVVAGYTGSSNINFMVARFNANGMLDTGFGFGGYNVIDFMGGADRAEAVAIAPDGKIVLAGTVFNGARYVFGIARFNTNGTPDNSFDLDAKQLVEFQFGVPHAATAVVVLSDRKIVVGGTVNSNFALLRLTESGGLDGTFGLSGLTQTDMGGTDALNALAVGPGGFLYAAGTRVSGLNSDFAAAQYRSNGTLAACPPFPCSVWSDGKAFVDMSLFDAAYAIDVRGDGAVVLAGEANGQFAWAQLTASDPLHPIEGITDFAGTGESARAARFTGANQLVLAGIQSWNGDDNFGLARFETTPGPASGVANERIPGVIEVGAPWPNPSSGIVSIDFTLGRAARIRVQVHDVTGRLVRLVNEGPFAAGPHQLTWDGRSDDGTSIASGVYFAGIEVDGRRIEFRRLTLLR